MAEKKALLYDGLGNPIAASAKPPAAGQAEIGRVRDPWAGSSTGEVSPELLARVLKGTASLQQQMLLAKRILSDDHVYAAMRNLIRSVMRVPWEVLPFDDSAGAKKDAEEVTQFLSSFRTFKRLLKFAIYGEFYPFVGAELQWNRDYGLDGYDPVNPARWAWDDATSSLRLLTIRDRTRGEPLENRRGWLIHQGELEPGTMRDSGLWRKVAWLWLFKNTTWGYWMRFAQNYGMPWVWAFIARPEDEATVLDAVTELNSNARGVFPVGTEIKLQEAQRYGTSALYDAIKTASEGGITKLIQGNVLNMDPKSGTGTLAGEHAERVSQANLEGVTEGLQETVQNDLVAPWCSWHFGEDQVRRGEIPVFQLKPEPPKDLEKKATVFVTVNQALRSVGKAIAAEQIEDEFGVRTVDLADDPDPSEDENQDPPKKDPPPPRLKAAAKPPRIRTKEDTEKVTEQLVARAAREFSEEISRIVERADSLEEAADAIWEGYRTLEVVRLGSALRDATLTANLQGRGDADADS